MATRPLNDLIQIARNGGGLDLQADNFSRDQLIQLVRNTVQKTTVILRGLNSRPTDELVQIVTAHPDYGGTRMGRPARASRRAWRAERPYSRPVAMTDKASA